MRASRGLKWENKMYKLKRSITSRLMVQFFFHFFICGTFFSFMLIFADQSKIILFSYYTCTETLFTGMELCVDHSKFG